MTPGARQILIRSTAAAWLAEGQTPFPELARLYQRIRTGLLMTLAGDL